MDSSEKLPLFDNPLTSKILTKEDVAKVFRKSIPWVARMMACGALPFHYVGDTAMFYSDEIVTAFLNDSLCKTRRDRNDSKKTEPERRDEIRSVRDCGRKKNLSEIRLL